MIMKKIMLDCSRLKERAAMRDYMAGLFGFSEEDGFTGNLDQLNDLLSEVTEDICICISIDGFLTAAGASFSWTVLRILMLGAGGNPHITISLV